jgi:hypothetical protein
MKSSSESDKWLNGKRKKCRTLTNTKSQDLKAPYNSTAKYLPHHHLISLSKQTNTKEKPNNYNPIFVRKDSL